jgi:quinol monooxygenase YgiN
VLESLIATRGPGQDGFLGSTRYGVLDDPDVLVEIADWESAEAREAHMHEATATGAYAPLLEMLAAPFRVTVISQLP